MSLNPEWSAWRVGSFRSRRWLLTWISWLAYYTVPLATGWILKRIFDALDTSQSVAGLLVALGVSEGVRMLLFAGAIWVVIHWWVAALTMLRTNMLHAQTVSGGPMRGRLPAGPAEAISRFHDDARDVVVWADSWVDVSANVGFAIGAIVIMASIDVGASLITIVPIALVTVIIRWIRPRLYAADKADREATAVVNSYLGETFAAMLAFRLAAKEPAAIERLETHTEHRRQTAVRHVVLEQSLDGLTSTTTDLSIGLILLALAPSVRRGDITVGDLALFVSYAGVLGEVPRFASRLVTAREHANVSLARMADMVALDRPHDVLRHPDISIARGDPIVEREADPSREPLARLHISGLTAHYPTTTTGVDEINLVVERGSFIAVTGAVGSGKSTLLRALAGLIPRHAGSVRWNDEPIDDLGAWFVPPQSAHLPQVPRLFSESLADNIALGRTDHSIDAVIEATRMRVDLADMPEGLETRVGARGLRLSGGQAQRVATARSLLTDPELLLVDDLSSALDVETERALWEHVRARETTVIAVSHRQFVLDMADDVYEMHDGRLIAR
ncbi:MAG: ABC transporter ATP-binding protein [Actinomycetota bacterium]